MTDPQTVLANRLKILEAEAEAAIGPETFRAGVQAMINAGGADHVAMHAIPRGETINDMNKIIGRPDAAERIIALSRDALLAAASADDKVAERRYAELRERERQAHAVSKGRAR